MVCDAEECDVRGRMVMVEKSTGVVVGIDPPMYLTHQGEGLRPAFPLLADKDGNQVWPKKS